MNHKSRVSNRNGFKCQLLQLHRTGVACLFPQMIKWNQLLRNGSLFILEGFGKFKMWKELCWFICIHVTNSSVQWFHWHLIMSPWCNFVRLEWTESEHHYYLRWLAMLATGMHFMKFGILGLVKILRHMNCLRIYWLWWPITISPNWFLWC